MATEDKEVKKPEQVAFDFGDTPKVEEVQSVQTPPVEIVGEKAVPEKKLTLTALLSKLRAKNEALKAEHVDLKDKAFGVKYQLSGLDHDDELKTLGAVLNAVNEIVTDSVHGGKGSLEEIIRKGDECPCDKHTALRLGAIMIKNGWVGKA